MPTTPVDEQEPDDHHGAADEPELSTLHGKELLKPGLDLIGEREVGQSLKKADQSQNRKKIPSQHIFPFPYIKVLKDHLPILSGFA